jgi:parvulin-like peptidyl-prolyl isomerase
MSDQTEKKNFRAVFIIIIFIIPPIIGLAAFLISEIGNEGKQTEGTEKPKSTEDDSTAGLPVLENKKPVQDGSEERKLSEDILNKRVYIRHILVAYRGAQEAGEKIKIGKEEAYNLALEIREKVAEKPEIFEETAKKYSDDRATGPQGGLIPPFNLKEMAPSFRDTIMQLKTEEISRVVETGFGFHIIKREHVEEAILQSILIPFKGALQAADAVVFSEEDARKQAEMIRKAIIEGRASFSEMAEKHSQDPWAKHGGYMSGIVIRGKSIPHKEIDDAAFRLKQGGVSKVFRSQLGYHIVKRHKVESRQARQIVVFFDRKRGKDVAEKIINRAYTALQKKVPFSEVVKTFSDEKGKEKTAGFTRFIYRGTWVYPLEEKLFSMKIGEVSKPIELPNAFVIIARVR